MRFHRFIGNFDLTAEQLIVDDAELASQISKVLRLKSGDSVLLCDGKGYEANAEIRSIRNASVSFRVEKKKKIECEPRRHVTLYCSILKRENFELVVQKTTEIGVSVIVPLLCERTVKQELKAERLAKIAKEASEQSGRGVVPVIKPPMKFDAALAESAQCEVRLFCHLSGKPLVPLAQEKMAALFIGPEGGWSDGEVAAATDSRSAIISLGALTLRAETAAIVATFCALR